MISSRRYEAGDAYKFNPRKDAFGEDENMAKRTDDIGKVNELCWSIVDDDRVIGVIGGALLWPGVLETYAMLSEDVKKHPIQFHRVANNILESLIEGLNLWRVQMLVREDFPQGQRWAETLGFYREGFLERYGTDRANYFMYVRLEDGVA